MRCAWRSAQTAAQAREIDLDRRRFEEFRNFTNKVWNGARFIFMHLLGKSPLSVEDVVQGMEAAALRLEDRWIISRVTRTIENVNQKLNEYFFDQAALEAYDFFWKEFCSYYLEISKPDSFWKRGDPLRVQKQEENFGDCFVPGVRLLHPMAPFITEELFQMLKEHFGNAGHPHPAADAYTKEFLQRCKLKLAWPHPSPM